MKKKLILILLLAIVFSYSNNEDIEKDLTTSQNVISELKDLNPTSQLKKIIFIYF